MRTTTIALTALTLGLLVDVRTSGAQQFIHYPWCLDAGGNESQFTSCAFNTFEQCMQTGWGDGGLCYRNPAYQPPTERQRQRPRRRS